MNILEISGTHWNDDDIIINIKYRSQCNQKQMF